MEPSVFEELFSRFYSPLCRFAFRLVNDREVAEDLVQEVFVKYWQRSEFLPPDVNPKAYLFQAVHNQALNHLSSQKKKVYPGEEAFLHIESGTNTDTGLMYEDLQKAIDHGLEQLSPVCKSVFLMSRNEEMTYQEIAGALEISLKTVEAHMSKALRILRKHLVSFLSIGLIVSHFVKILSFF